MALDGHPTVSAASTQSPLTSRGSRLVDSSFGNSARATTLCAEVDSPEKSQNFQHSSHSGLHSAEANTRLLGHLAEWISSHT